MKCRYCNIALAPLRRLTDGEFCCDDHRHAFSEEQAARTEVFLQPPPQDALLPLTVSFSGGIPGSTAGPIGALEPREFKPTVVKPASSLLSPETEMFLPDPPLLDRLLPLQFSGAPADADTGCTEELPGDLEFPGVIALPQCTLDQISIPVEAELAAAPELILPAEPALSFESKAIPEEEQVETHPTREVANSWHWLRDAWRNAPRDLKVVTVLLPVLLAVAVGPAVRKGKGHVASTSKPALPSVHALPSVRSLPSLPSLPALPSLPSGQVQQVVSSRLTDLHQTILNRAAVDLTDDFRSGLDAWESHSNLTTSWSYDATGFVQPGPLAVFKPSKDLMDYRFQFLGEIDQKGLGAAFRAANLDNYYVVKLAVVKPGPLPVVHLVRYAVINGKEERHVERPLQLAARPDTLYRMVLDIRGGDFTIMAQGQLVDFWTDNRLPRGGVGFFCSRGE